MADGKTKTVSLVLGGGGARGLAHIGVIHWLRENGYEIRSISGSSMGALIGGIYATGKLNAYEQWVRPLTRLDIITLLDLSLERGGFVKGDKIINILKELIGDQPIEALPIGYTAVATDIRREREIWIKKGSLFEAIRASISLPLFFTPVDYKGIKLIDGGVLNPVPIAPTFSDDTDMTIAVNLGGRLEKEPFVKKEATAKETDDSPALHRKIARFIERLKPASPEDELKGDWRVYEVASQSFEMMQSAIARQKLAAYPPDVLIEIPRNACRTLDFDRADEMIELGYRKAGQALAEMASKREVGGLAHGQPGGDQSDH